MLLVHGAPKLVWAATARLSHFGHLIHPEAGNVRVFGSGYPWAGENGAFGTFNEAAFRRMLEKIAGRPGKRVGPRRKGAV